MRYTDGLVIDILFRFRQMPIDNVQALHRLRDMKTFFFEKHQRENYTCITQLVMNK